MTHLKTEISRNDKDILQKCTSNLFRDKSLEFYGIKSAKIKELINVEIPAVKVAERATDAVFLLEDETYLHLEFQTTSSKNDLIRFAHYDFSLFERDGRKIKTVVIYSADVKRAAESIDIGQAVYSVDTVMMGERDGNAVYADLGEKINSGVELTDIDMINLIFLPLMGSDIPKDDIALQAAALAQNITDRTKKELCIAAAVAFGEKYLKKSTAKKIMEVLEMGSVFQEFVEERIEAGIEERVKDIIEERVKDIEERAEERVKNIEEHAEERIKQTAINTAINALREGADIDFVAKITGLDVETVERLRNELG
jgi:hypothetical protein